MSSVLQTARLTLRELDPARDGHFVAAMLGDPVVMAYWPAALTSDESQAWVDRQIARYQNDGCGYWLAELTCTSQSIGQIGIMLIDVGGGPEAALGYILHRAYWGRGYATEGGAACIHWAFEHLNVTRVIAPVRPENLASTHVAERLGLAVRNPPCMLHGFRHELYSIDCGQIVARDRTARCG